MNENQLIEYKKTRSPFQWLKNAFNKLTERFKKPQNATAKVDDMELSDELLDNVKAGFPLSESELHHSWDLTNEQLSKVHDNYPNVINQVQSTDLKESDELSAEELDKITAGNPILDDPEL